MGTLSRLAAVISTVSALGLVVAGCGSSGPVSPSLAVSVTVPVNGATVVVPSVRLVGEVSASQTGARLHLRVRGHRVRVRRGGTFVAQVHLHRGLNRIRVVASAPGYPRTFSLLTVRFRPGPPPRPPSLATEVNAACNTLSTKDFASTFSAPAVNLAILERLVAADAQALARIQRLTPPPGQATLYGQFVSSLRGVVTGEQMLVAGVKAHSLAEIRQGVRPAVADWRALQRLGSRLGFASCVTY